MAYFSGTTRVNGKSLTLKSSAAQTASTVGSAVKADRGGSLLVTVAVTAASGTTPTMTVAIQGSVDNSTWVTLGTVGANGYNAGSTAVTAPSNLTTSATVRAVVPAMPYVRYSSTIAGTTPSFTYSVAAVAL